MKPQEKVLINKIIELTNLIQEKYPELIYELEEYNFYTGGEEDPIDLQQSSDINFLTLKSYLDSLKETLKHYIQEKGKKDLYLIEHL
jgi:hypothetical protein